MKILHKRILLLLLFFSYSISLLSAQQSLKEIHNLQYYSENSPDSSQTKLNLLLPKNIKKPPLLLWIGQGAWAYVNKDTEMGICQKIAKQGIAVASVGHRLSPALIWKPYNKKGVQHPEHIKDIAQAFKWLYTQAEKYGYDKQNIFVGGYSSGAQLSALLAMDNRYLKAVGLSNKLIKAIIPISGCYDIPAYRKGMLKEDTNADSNHIFPVFGNTHEQHLDASPVTYVDSLITPILLISESYSYEYTNPFEQMLAKRKYKNVDVLNVHSLNHAELWYGLKDNEHNIYRDFIVAYIKRQSLLNKRND